MKSKQTDTVVISNINWLLQHPTKRDNPKNQKELARASGVSASKISRILNSDGSILVEDVLQIAEALGVTVSELVYDNISEYAFNAGYQLLKRFIMKVIEKTKSGDLLWSELDAYRDNIKLHLNKAKDIYNVDYTMMTKEEVIDNNLNPKEFDYDLYYCANVIPWITTLNKFFRANLSLKKCLYLLSGYRDCDTNEDEVVWMLILKTEANEQVVCLKALGECTIPESIFMELINLVSEFKTPIPIDADIKNTMVKYLELDKNTKTDN